MSIASERKISASERGQYSLSDNEIGSPNRTNIFSEYHLKNIVKDQIFVFKSKVEVQSSILINVFRIYTNFEDSLPTEKPAHLIKKE
jgi:hypothetical protein